MLIGEILDNTLGYSHHHYIQDEILRPLELNNTFNLLSEVNLDDVMSGYFVGYDLDIKQNDYINRNETLERAIKQFNQNFSNDYRNTEYQENHTAYFVTLNSQFWWVYYILCLILLYQIVYIQNEMNLKTKVILGIILTLYPLSYRIYDLVGTKK